jgi:hypothetical protein
MVHDYCQFQIKQPAESREPDDVYNLRATNPSDQAFKPIRRARALCSNTKRSSRSIWMGGRSEDLTEILELDNLIRNCESTCARGRNFFS